MTRRIHNPYQDTQDWTVDELDAEAERLPSLIDAEERPITRRWLSDCLRTITGDLDARRSGQKTPARPRWDDR